MKRMLRMSAILLLVLLFGMPFASAAEVAADETYPFTGSEFLSDGQLPEGIYLVAVPDQTVCAFRMGSRLLRPGDVLAASDLERLTLQPMLDENRTVELCYRPIGDGTLGERVSLTMQIRSTKNEAPTAMDLHLETYKNIPNEGWLRAEDPEGDSLLYRIENKPGRGTVELEEDGSFVYTPKKNKVGEDSFSYTVTDTAGNTSEPATVRIRILQPLDSQTFDDLAPQAQFPAMWLKEAGLYGGTRMTDKLCFCPEEKVSRGEFLAMAMDLAGIEPEIGLETGLFADQDEAADWLRPYLSSAMRRGIALGYPGSDGLEFRPNQPITKEEAALILSRCLPSEPVETVGAFSASFTTPARANASEELREDGALCDPQTQIDRLTAARLLYQAAAGLSAGS